MSSAKVDKLVRMANQIGEAFAAMPQAEAVAGAASHLKKFWAPKMIGELMARAGEVEPGLNDIAARAVARLKAQTPS